ncbi:hypothetical protein ACFL03_05745 [Thermodesulfobacteriota bacterium]
MKSCAIVVLLFSIIFIAPAFGYCAERYPFIERMEKGSINWTEGYVESKGIGTPLEKHSGKQNPNPKALWAAKQDAIHNILEIIQDVRIDSATTVKDFAEENDVIRSKVESMAREAREVGKEYLSDSTVVVTMQMSLRGGFAQLILPQGIKQVDSIKAIVPAQETVSPKSSIPSDNPVVLYSGLVVDARGLGAKAVMSPKIFDENGQEVYGPTFVSREFAVQQGMSEYVMDLTAAQSSPKVASTPLTVRGLRTEKPGGSNIIISNADVSKLKSASEHLSFLKKCRVVIVVDSPGSKTQK